MVLGEGEMERGGLKWRGAEGRGAAPEGVREHKGGDDARDKWAKRGAGGGMGGGIPKEQ